MRKRLLAVPLLCALSACGASAPRLTPATNRPAVSHELVVPVRAACPPGHSEMGCSVQPSPLTSSGDTGGAPSGCKIPDVSSYQGHPDWAAAKAWGICGGIFKAGEYQLDPDAQYNADSLSSLHVWHALYWFVRNTGCSHEAAQIIAAAHQLHVGVVINDLEVPEAAGYGACLVPAEKNAHLIAVDYTAPGSWPGGAGSGEAPLWQAEYGPTLHPFWQPVVAWQCTDGTYGCATSISGIGQGDVSVNMGITSLGSAPRLVCWGKGSTPGSDPCRRLEAQAHKLWDGHVAFAHAIPHWQAVVKSLGGRVAQLERELKAAQSALGSGEKNLRSRLYWSARKKHLHDQLVSQHHG